MEQTAGLIPLAIALEKMQAPLSAVTETHRLPLAEAAGRVLAAPVVSPAEVPPFDNAAMDGYAVRLADVIKNPLLPVAGKAFAGQPYQGVWPENSCIRIMTGAPIPAACDAVVMQEETEVSPQGVRFLKPVNVNQNIRRQGEDIAKGQTILSAGVRLGATHLAMAASLGIDQLEVYRPLRIAIFSTGDELIAPGQMLQSGQIYDTNRLAVHIMLQELGYEVSDLGIIPDDPQVLRQTFLQASEQADVVISSGGVSVGEADYTKRLLEELGEVTFWKLAIKPGKPFAFGSIQKSWFCGLPGNPVSAIVTFCQLVKPLLAKLSGITPLPQPLRLRVRTASPLKKTPGRLDFQRGKLVRHADGELTVVTTGHQGSHIFSSFAEGDCFIVLEQERGNVTPGEWVEIEPFGTLLGAHP